ncbi:hypothetical protein X797_011811 [Metarhizium robertsii]|uniref:Chromo shadow domain-containing protein n=1 Tax=Metarhizium robertsii TaxID=568076 RepID=A0A014MVB5_9HYPO|nr:hypothetical protein X797_011811 [Metarhizium robertsii]
MPNIKDNPRYNLRPRLSVVKYYETQSGRRPEESTKWTPSSDSWEDEIAFVADAARDNTGKITFQVTWTNGDKSTCEATELYKKCPQKAGRSLSKATSY